MSDSELVRRLRAKALRASMLPAPEAAAAIRQAAGATQDDVAAELGVHRVTVARWENATRRPQGELRERYARLLDELAQLAESEGGGHERPVAAPANPPVPV